MIYVIKSLGKRDENLPCSVDNSIEIIKIGFTEDINVAKRISSYRTHNINFDVLFKISSGTLEDEFNLHRQFQ
jgi:hypothetical protein